MVNIPTEILERGGQDMQDYIEISVAMNKLRAEQSELELYMRSILNGVDNSIGELMKNERDRYHDSYEDIYLHRLQRAIHTKGHENLYLKFLSVEELMKKSSSYILEHKGISTQLIELNKKLNKINGGR